MISSLSAFSARRAAGNWRRTRRGRHVSLPQPLTDTCYRRTRRRVAFRAARLTVFFLPTARFLPAARFFRGARFWPANTAIPASARACPVLAECTTAPVVSETFTTCPVKKLPA